MKTFTLSVITPTETLLEIPHCLKAQIQLADGSGIGILPGHAPLLAETEQALVRYTNETGEHEAEFEAGILQIDEVGATIFTSGWARSVDTAVTNLETQSRPFYRLAQSLLADLNSQIEQYERDGDG